MTPEDREEVREMISFQEAIGRVAASLPTEDCPDHGPAKEAAPPTVQESLTPAPQRGTATGALSAEREADGIADDYGYSGTREGCKAAILALVKREREAERDECLRGEQSRADSLVKRVLAGEAKARKPLERDLAAAKERIAELEAALLRIKTRVAADDLEPYAIRTIATDALEKP